MSEFQKVSPLLDKWSVGSLIGRNGGTSVYQLTNNSTSGSRRGVLKHITIPASDNQVKALIYTGAVSNESQAHQYYKNVVDDLERELALINSVADQTNILIYRDCQIVEKEGKPGFDVYLICDYCDSLPLHLENFHITKLRALNLGLDICGALSALRSSGLIHRDIKPENIFVNEFGQYMLGDLGVARIDSLAGSHVPNNLISDFSPPELHDVGAEPGITIDIYALGLILYRIFNGMHAPFEDEKTSKSSADRLRLEGEPFPFPIYADYELSEIILKACAFKPEDRYQTPDEFHRALRSYSMRNEVADEVIVPPIIHEQDIEPTEDWSDGESDPEQETAPVETDSNFAESFAPAEIPVVSDGEQKPEVGFVGDLEPDEEPEAPPAASKPNRRGKLLIIAAAVLAVAFAATAAVTLLWPTVTIRSFMAETLSSTEILLQWTPEGYEPGGWTVTYSDVYGNTRSAQTGENKYTFTGLNPGTSYTFTITPDKDHIRVNGIAQLSSRTNSHTEVAAFTAQALSSSEVLLEWTVSGTQPDGWVVIYGTQDGAAQTLNAGGNRATVTGLVPDTLYVFDLTSDFGTELTGQRQVTCRTKRLTTIEAFTGYSELPSSIQLEWSFDGSVPELWTLEITGSDGTLRNERTMDARAEITGLISGVSYTITLSAGDEIDIAGQNLTTVTTVTSGVASISAETVDFTTVSVSWKPEGLTPDEWVVYYSYDGGATEASVTSTEPQVTIGGLLPTTSYRIRIASEEFALTGELITEVRTMDAERFEDYGCENAIMVLYQLPDKDQWSHYDLSTPKNVFSPGEPIAYAINADYEETEEDKTVNTTYVIRNHADGTVVTYFYASRSWDGSWVTASHTGSIDVTPQTPGEYRINVYFNNKLMATTVFSIA